MTIQEISDLRKTQDNKWHITSLPLYTVQKKVRRYGFTEDYVGDAGNYVWICEGEEVTNNELIAKLNEVDDNWQLEEGFDKNAEENNWRNGKFSDYEKVYYKEDWEFVTLFFTEKSAREYVATKGYRHGELRLYVDSAYNNSELRAVIGVLEGKG